MMTTRPAPRTTAPGPRTPPPRTGRSWPVPPLPAPRVRPLGALAALALSALVAFAVLPPAAAAWAPAAYAPTAERDLRVLTNQARVSAGRSALRNDKTLSATARGRSRDMATRNYFAHTTPEGTLVFDELDRIKYCYRLAGENIGYTTHPDAVAVATVQGMFMKSSGHRKNILGKSWDSIGVGAYTLDGTKMLYTVLFADRC